MAHADVVVIGGGVIGLAVAWELARQGEHVRLIDRQTPGQEASWAGAGILPPANRATAAHPYGQLCGLSLDLHPQWAAALQEATGIDTGFRRCGGIYLARSAGETAALNGWAGAMRDEQIAIERLDGAALCRLEPELSDLAPTVRAAYLLPQECQLRNPRYVRALLQACRAAGVEVTADCEALDVVVERDRVARLETSAGSLQGERYCFTSGAWTGRLLAKLGLEIAVLPIRGQMVLFRCAAPPLRHVLNEGPRYLVPRDDGHVLVGATEEEVGFDKRNTDEAISDLRSLACELVPALRQAEVERTWAGLRPATFDGFPYLGKLPALDNAYVAAGHFRSGLFLSPGTAVVMRQLLRGETPEIDLQPFRVGR
jgi:glycine oxidase